MGELFLKTQGDYKCKIQKPGGGHEKGSTGTEERDSEGTHGVSDL